MWKSLVICCLLLPLIGSPGSASESEQAAIVKAAKDLYAKAWKAGELWTCIQLEAYAEAKPELKLRLKEYLSASTIIGDPLFAFPRHIRNSWDRGAEVLVLADRRLYRLADDGRPVALPLDVPFNPAQSAVSGDRSKLGLATRAGNDRNPEVLLGVMDAVTGKPLWQRKLGLGAVPEKQNDRLHHQIRVSADGSAVTTAVYRQGAQPANNRIIVASAGRHRVLPNMRSSHAIGPNERWLIAERNDRKKILYTAAGEWEVRSWAHALGHVVVAEGNELRWVDSAGAITPFTPSIGVGRRPEIRTMGPWLVLRTGAGAETEATTDLTGNTIEGGEAQADSLAIFKWADLVADRAAEPALFLPGQRLSIHRGQAAAFFTWNSDGDVSMIQLDGDRPVVEAIASVGKPVTWVDSNQHYILVHHPEWGRTLLDDSGTVRWEGTARDVWLNSRKHLIHRPDGEQQPYTLVHLGDSLADNTSLQLDLPPAPWWSINVDRFNRRAVADSQTQWMPFDPMTGKLGKATIKDDTVQWPRPPWWRNEDNNHGRFYRSDGRLIPKNGGPDGKPVTEVFAPLDAVHLGRSLLILDRNQHIYLGGGRKPFESIGLAAADRFAAANNGKDLVLSRGGNRQIVARVSRGPSIDDDIDGMPDKADDLDRGKWRVEGRKFTPPTGSSMDWSEELSGFQVERLRSGSSKGLLVITRSLIIELGTRDLKKVATVKR